MNQQYCLRWKYHHTNLQTMFSQLLDRGCFCDVTLACEGRTLRAHRVVLCACSSYFDSILTNSNSDKDPIIIMKDCKFDDIKCLIDFMYKGEINVEHEKLSSLLRTAEDLRIKGLAEVSWHENDKATRAAQRTNNPQTASIHSTGSVNGTTATRLPSEKRNSISSNHSNQNHLSSDDQDPLGETSRIDRINHNNREMHIMRHSVSASSSLLQPMDIPMHGANTESSDEMNTLPLRKKRGRPPLDDDFDSYSTPKITLVEGAVANEFTPTNENSCTTNSHGEEPTNANSFLEQRMDVSPDDDDVTEIVPKIERPDTPISVRNDSSDYNDYSLKSPHDDGDQHESSSQDLLTPQEEAEWSDVIKMNDYLAKGRRPQFWEETFTKRVMEAIKTKDLEMKKAAQLLGVSYGTLYGRYRETYGCLKHPSRGPILLSSIRDFLADGHEEIIRRLQRGEITLPRAAELMNTSTSYLSNLMD